MKLAAPPIPMIDAMLLGANPCGLVVVGVVFNVIGVWVSGTGGVGGVNDATIGPSVMVETNTVPGSTVEPESTTSAEDVE